MRPWASALPTIIVGTRGRDLEQVGPEGVCERVSKSLDAGFCVFDTAPLYGYGRIEEWLGASLRGREEQALVLGKVGLRWDSDHGDVLYREVSTDGISRVVRRDSRPQSVRADVEGSLRRLQRERLDLVQVHQRDRHVPLAETLGELAHLREEGKVDRIGLSNFSQADIEEALATKVPLETHQIEYSLLSREAGGGTCMVTAASGMGLLAYSTTGAGLLGGRAAMERAGGSAYAAEVLRRSDAELRPVAESLGLAVAQLAILWTISQPGVAGAVVGMRTDGQLAAASALRGRTLSGDDARAIEGVFRGLTLKLDETWFARLKSRAARAARAVNRRIR
jgi:aryl-alcohol dehydrogenase-like predicted oxidoreductase